MVIILTGAPASGKSTVAERLASCLDRAAHIQVDFFRKMVKGGYASPHHWNDEVDRQYRIARTSAAQTARNLAVAGFLPILDDIVPPAWVDEWQREAGLIKTSPEKLIGQAADWRFLNQLKKEL